MNEWKGKGDGRKTEAGCTLPLAKIPAGADEHMHHSWALIVNGYC